MLLLLLLLLLMLLLLILGAHELHRRRVHDGLWLSAQQIDRTVGSYHLRLLRLRQYLNVGWEKIYY